MTDTPPISFLAYRVEPSYKDEPNGPHFDVVGNGGRLEERLLGRAEAEMRCADLNAAYVKGFHTGRTSADVLALVDAAKGIQDWANSLNLDGRLIGRIDAAMRPFMDHINRVRELIAKAENEPDLHNKGTDRLLSAIEKAEPAIPDGFEVREFEFGWYPCADFDNRGNHRVFYENGRWSVSLDKGWGGDCGYRTRSDALADMQRWVEAAKREPWYATMKRGATVEVEEHERFDELTGPMPDESGASGGWGNAKGGGE